MLTAIPALGKTAIIFAVIIFAIRKKLSLANAFMAGAILLALFFRLSFSKTMIAFFECLTDPKTITICLIVALILMLSSSLEQCGQLKRMLGDFRGLIKNPKLNLALFPAIIGLLPMPGGSVFSAPMVKELGGQSELPADYLSYINYWFRHIWEYWWPMYPGVLLATLLADINLAAFIAMMLPFTLIVVLIGWIPVEGSRLHPAAESLSGDKRIRPFLKEIAPILFVIVAGIGLGWIFSAASGGRFAVAKETGLIMSLCAGNLMVWRSNAMSRPEIRKIVVNPHVFNMVYMIAAILLFKQILENSGAVDEICSELIALKIPLVLIWGILPFIVGLLTGITIAFVGSTFPILITLAAAQGQEQLMMPYIMLALSCGFSGVLLSPVHLCLLLSNNFFGTTLPPVYRLLWFPCLCLIGWAFVYFALLHRFLG
jgi:hypothetical protein